MAQFISKPESLADLAAQTEAALIQISALAKAGIVPETSAINPNRSQFLVIDGVLKFYNRTDETTTAI